jgi:hypothetical protein
MRIVGEFGQDGGRIHRDNPGRARAQASNKSGPVAASPDARQPREQSADIKASPPAATSSLVAGSDPGAKIAGDAGSTVSLNFMGPVVDLPRKDAPLSEASAGQMTPIQIAVYPDASKEAWDTLLCSASGQLLVTQTQALLKRRAALEALLREGRFNHDVPEKHEERIAAEKELGAIGREISKFKERTKAILAAAVH